MLKRSKKIWFLFGIVFMFSCSFAHDHSTISPSPDPPAPIVNSGKTLPKPENESAPTLSPGIHPAQQAPEEPAGRIEVIANKTTTPSEPAIIQENRNSEQPQDPMQAQEQESLDQALELFSQSSIYWKRGDIDNALNCLDEAYGFILEINGDPVLTRQKDDLRLMISKRILEICASRHIITAGKHSEIPLIMNADVEREIRSFQTGERNFFIRSYQRSCAYRPVILKLLKESGLPAELSWLPLVESGFQVNALSRARALGLWQFIPSTGYKYTLVRDRFVDERMDLEKSTRAAIAYLKELHEIFGDWLTVLAAYNCGEGKVLRTISKQHINYLDHFWDLYRQLPNETARYVPRFLATLQIIREPAKYGMQLEVGPDIPIAHEFVKTSRCMRLQDIADHLKISRDVMCSLNTELRFQITPERDYNLKVPTGMSAQLLAALDKIPQADPPRSAVRLSKKNTVRHRVKKGETLNGIARKYHVSSEDIMAMNDLPSRKLRTGQKIRIPRAGKALARKGAVSKSEKVTRYKVKSGDTLSSIAKRFNTTVPELVAVNGLQGSKLKVNKVLLIRNRTLARTEKSTKEITR